MATAKVKIDADGTGFFSTIKRVDRSMKGLGDNLSALKGGFIGAGVAMVAAFGAHVIESAVRKTIEFAGQVKDISESFDVSTDFVQQFNGAIMGSGGRLADITKMMEKLAEAREKALGGDAATISKFAKFGISQGDLVNLNTEQLMTKSMGRLSQPGAASLLPDLRDLYGKSATKLIGAFANGVDSAMGQIKFPITEKTISSLDTLADELEISFTNILGSMANFLAAWGPMVNRMIQTFDSLTSGITNAETPTESFWEYIKVVLNPMGGIYGSVIRAVDNSRNKYGTEEEQAIAAENRKYNKDIEKRLRDLANRRQRAQGVIDSETKKHENEKKKGGLLLGAGDLAASTGNFVNTSTGAFLPNGLETAVQQTNTLIVESNKTLASIDRRIAVWTSAIIKDVTKPATTTKDNFDSLFTVK